jgi:hypothetical protein
MIGIRITLEKVGKMKETIFKRLKGGEYAAAKIN